VSLPGVLCVGRVYCDVVFSGLQNLPVSGEEVYAERLSLHTGGGAAITASYLAASGVSTELCANLPADPFGPIIQNELQGRVGLSACAIEKHDDPQLTVVLTGNVDRSFVTRRAGNALPESYVRQMEELIEATAIGHIHIGELETLLEYPDLVRFARSANWTISLDCAWDVSAMSNAKSLPLIESVDVFFPNESEFNELAGIGVSSQSAPITVVKKGENGAQAFTADGECHAPAENINCVDATGAGDAFNAGFIHAWVQGESIQRCLQAGNRCGANAVSHIGGPAVV